MEARGADRDLYEEISPDWRRAFSWNASWENVGSFNQDQIKVLEYQAEEMSQSSGSWLCTCANKENAEHDLVER